MTATRVRSRQRQIEISDGRHALPYSKGLMASSIMVTGAPPERAFAVAELIEQRLHEGLTSRVTRAELSDLAVELLEQELGFPFAVSYKRWRVVNELDRPLVIVVGGATGVGKSTLATQLAARLGITRVIPTDAIREIMRSMFTEEFMPTLHTPSFDAERLVRHPLPKSADPVIIGFREQCMAVGVAVQALIRRAVVEGTDLILEGAHLVPGSIQPGDFPEAAVVHFMVTADDEELHRAHFLMRAHESRGRPADRYFEFFDNIRDIQRYLKLLAHEHEVPVIPSYDLDATLAAIIELVAAEAMRDVTKSEKAITKRKQR